MPVEFPPSVLECFLRHTTHLHNLPEESRNFLHSYLGVYMNYIQMRDYLCQPADVAAHTKLAQWGFPTMQSIDDFVTNHDSLLPQTLSEQCTSGIMDKPYFIHRGWGGISLESSIEMNVMTSFSFEKHTAEGFSFTGRVTTVELTSDVLNNSLYVGEMAQVRQEEEIILFPGKLTRVSSDLYEYTPHPKHHLRDKIDDRRPGMQAVLNDLRARSIIQRDARIGRRENSTMGGEETKGWILHIYESLRADPATTPPVTIFADNSDLNAQVHGSLLDGAVIQNISTDMDGVIRGYVDGNPIRIIFDTICPDSSELFMIKNGQEFKFYVSGYKYRGHRRSFV